MLLFSLMLFVRHIQQQMRNIGLMVITMISPKTEKKKTEKPVVPGVIMASGQQAVMNLLKMVRVQTAISQQQLASVQAVHGKAHWSWRQLVVRLLGAALTAAWEALSLNKVIWWSDDFSCGLRVNIKSVWPLGRMLYL